MGFYRNKARNKEEKVISMCDSVCHFMTCGGNANVSKRKVFIDYCEYVVRKKLSSEELMHKLSELDVVIEYIESNWSKQSNDNNTTTTNNNNNNVDTVSKEEATTQTNEQKLLLTSNNNHNSNNENSINIIIDDESH